MYRNAWGGDERTNAFITWVGQETERPCGVSVEQVKLTDTAEAVSRVLSEKAAGQDDGGSDDLIWINGPNFLVMREQGLLYGPFAADLPNARYLDLSPLSPNAVDFTVPVDGMESPWRLAKFVFTYDSARVEAPPQGMAGFTDWAAAHPGRFSHPDPAVLQQPVTEAAFAAAAAPLWGWSDALRPNLWHGDESFRRSSRSSSNS